MKSYLLPAALLVVGGSAELAEAAVIRGAVAATASSEFSNVYDIGNTIDQSGLSTGYISGVTDFDAYIAGNPTHTLVAANNEWFTPSGVTTATVTYDLGAVFDVDRLALWNEEAAGFGTGALSFSVDGVSFSGLGTINPFDNPGNSDYLAQVFSTGFTGRFFRMDVSDCPQPDGTNFDGCGIGEVAFSTDAAVIPVPAAGFLLVTALGGLGLLRKRRGA